MQCYGAHGNACVLYCTVGLWWWTAMVPAPPLFRFKLFSALDVTVAVPATLTLSEPRPQWMSSSRRQCATVSHTTQVGSLTFDLFRSRVLMSTDLSVWGVCYESCFCFFSGELIFQGEFIQTCEKKMDIETHHLLKHFHMIQSTKVNGEIFT